MNLNIVGEIKRSEVVELNPYAKDASYAELSPNDKIQMFYKQEPVDKFLPESPITWCYLSYANLWMGSSDNMSKKRLLKIVG